MSLKAGRVGVNPNQVDPVDGSIKSSATEGYTKQEADAKFVTHEAAAALQPKQLAVPLKMLSGSKLTVESALQGLNEEKFERAEQRVLGAKNILPNNFISRTINGVTFTVNADGSVTANGTASADVYPSYEVYLKKGKYIFNGVNGGSNATYFIDVTNKSSGIRIARVEDGDTAISISDDMTVVIFFNIKSGYVANNLRFYPMLRLASDPDDTYVPYAMTNKELTEMMTPVEGTITTEGTLDATVTSLVKIGKTVFFKMKATGVTKEAWASFASVPSEYKPKQTVYVPCMISGVTGLNYCQISTNGYISCSAALTDSTVTIVNTSWITS